MEALQLKVALRILEHAGIITCLVGEIALNYYNVPRVLHDIEICVPEALVSKAASILRETGLFKAEDIADFDLYNDYKRGCPRFRSSSWISPSCTFVLFADSSYGLDPLIENVVSHHKVQSIMVYSSQIMDLIPAVEINNLPMPYLSPLFIGLCQRFFRSNDDVAMVAVEQLVDGMDIDNDWCKKNLCNASPKVQQLATRLVAGKRSRLDDFSENTVTCFVANAGEAERLRQIPGYE